MKRREFITLIGGAVAVAWPLVARAQQLRRIGVLMGLREDDPQTKRHLDAFRHAISSLGWVDGQNIKIEHRAAPDLDALRSGAADLLSHRPDLMVTYPTPPTDVVRQASASTRIVFISVSDPIGPGFAKSLQRPGGNITGFTNFEETMGGKWLDLLREIAPSVSRAAMMYSPRTANAGATGGLYLKSIESAARASGTELAVSPVDDLAGIDDAFVRMAQDRRSGVLVMPNVFTIVNREHIVRQAAQHSVPAIYPMVQFVTAGGLLSYGVDTVDLFRRAASYADSILKGANPTDLPVQQPTKFELVINKKTANRLGLNVPNTLLVAADEVIE